MQHTNFHKKDSWIGNGHETCREQQIEMIRRHYSDYDADRDYVLWIIADFFHPYTAVIQGQVQVRKRDGEEIKVSQLTRTPYPNKGIRQVSMKSGRKRLYGIPLIFHSFEELCEVKEVLIRWDLFVPIYLRETEQGFDLRVENVVIRYELGFEKDSDHEDYRFFTIHSKDYVLDAFDEDTGDRSKEYYGEFDLALNATGVFEMDMNEVPILPPMISEIYDLTGSVVGEESRPLTKKENEALTVLSELEQDNKMVRKSLQEVIIKEDVQWEGYYYERAEVLTATSIADLVPEPSFGFRDIC